MKKTRKEKKRLFFISLTICFLLVLLVTTIYKNFIVIVDNKKDTKTLAKEYETLLDNQKKLSSRVIKMQDPEYMARYAKEQFLYTSEDEIIIRID